MSVLIGVDFSSPAWAAAQAAAHLAKRSKVPLVLGHVVALEQAEERASLEARLESLAKDLVEATGATVVTDLEVGAPEEGLIRMAEQNQATLIVVSAVGRRAGSQWLLGSTAERLAQTAPLPVLVVRDAAALEQWARGDRPFTALFAADFSPASEAAARWIAGARDTGKLDVVALHLYWPPEERARLGLRGPGGIFEHNPDLEAVLQRDLGAKLAALKTSDRGTLELRVALGLGRLSDHVLSWAEQEKADLVVVGRHDRTAIGRLWHGSVSHGVLHHAKVSVVCVPPDATPAERGIPELRRILVAVDGSPLSARAVQYACATAAAGRVVTLLHVLDGPEPSNLPTPPEVRQRMEAERAAMEKEIRPRLLAMIPQDVDARGILVTLEFAQSLDVPMAILQAAERTGAELICLASHGRKGVTRALMGSIAQEVLRRSRRPVMIVKPPPEG